MTIELPTEPTPPTEDLSRMFLLIYGPPKIGKSTLASTFPDALFVATEQGLRFLNVLQVPCVEWLAFKEIVGKLIEEDAKARYKTIVIDTVDLLYTACELYVCNKHNLAHPSEEEWGKGWDYVRKEFHRGMLALTGAGYGVVFISHEKISEVSIAGIKKSRTIPAFSNTARKIILPLVDFIFYLGSDRERPEVAERRLYCRPHLEYESGGRQAYMPEYIDEIDYHNVLDAISMAKARENREKETVTPGSVSTTESKMDFELPKEENDG